jgi:RHS repeat-associated protein
VLELVDEEGNIAWHDPADIWGKREKKEPRADEIHCPIGFPGQVWVPQLGLYYNRHRFYCPETAHYLTPDPVGIWGGLDSYRYSPDPVNYVDPDGLKCRGKNDDDILYRGDDRPPETICQQGFQPSNPSANLSIYDHVEGVPDSPDKPKGSNWVSTSHDMETAENFGDTVYLISNPGCGEEVDCDPDLIDKYGPDPKDSEHEIAFNKPIPPGKIIGFYKPSQGGMASFQACP